MSRRCELTGIAVQTGNKVSHSNIKTRTRFLPNLVQVTLISESLERAVRLRVSAAALRSVEHRGGLDNFLLKARDGELSEGAAALKREIVKKQAEADEAAWIKAKAQLESEWSSFETEVKKYVETFGKQIEQQQATFKVQAAAQVKAWHEAADKFQIAA